MYFRFRFNCNKYLNLFDSALFLLKTEIKVFWYTKMAAIY